MAEFSRVAVYGEVAEPRSIINDSYGRKKEINNGVMLTVKK